MKIRMALTIATLAVLPFATPAQAGGSKHCGWTGCNPSHPNPDPTPTPTPTPTPVPEPSDAALLLIGAAGVAFGRWQQRRKG